jgi:hypothetical protein
MQVLRSYARILSDRSPLLPHSMPAYRADIYAPRTPLNTFRIVYKLLRENERNTLFDEFLSQASSCF